MFTHSEQESSVEQYLERFLLMGRTGEKLEKERDFYLRLPLPASEETAVHEAYNRARKRLGFTDDRHQVGIYKRVQKGLNWYEPLEADLYWPPVRDIIESKLGSSVEDIDFWSTAVLNGLRPPKTPQNSKGLVVGYVQSGKTTNFMSVIAKAADAGFRLIIVLTGITENLRIQTQKRLEEQLLSPTSEHWTRLTDEQRDFSGDKNPDGLAKETNRYIAVVKKNSHRLRRLNAWLNRIGSLVNEVPILIIDDEADQASIDVSPKAKQERSAINRQINDLLSYKRASYIAYTATPFANILIDPSKINDLYPSDFILSLPEPEGYFGSRALFGREPLSHENWEDIDTEGFDMVREISLSEVEAIRPATSSDPDKKIVGGEALREAIRWFILATAARRARGQIDDHSSMLVHTSMLTDDHDDLKEAVEIELNKIKAEINSKVELSPIWVSQWTAETTRVPSILFGQPKLLFEEISHLIPEVVNDVLLIVDNGKSDERLNYEFGRQTVIAIGGNTLSRGLTLEGLVSSYFVRRASAYDTLLQMGRWFGFRPGYEDLPRIWMPAELSEWFHDLSTIEAELREELEVYVTKEASPLEVQTRIRLHPAMAVTSQAKMQSYVTTSMSFANKKVQTIVFKHKNTQWLQNNIDATRALVTELQQHGISEEIGALNSPVFRNVDSEIVLGFLDKYEIHEGSRLGKDKSKHLRQYIQQESDSRRLRFWNISFITQSSDKLGTIDLGLKEKVNLLNRAKDSENSSGDANIKALISTIDRLNDVRLDSDEERKAFRANVKKEAGKNPEPYMRKTHETLVGVGVGHLAVYPIYRLSEPTNSASARRSLEANETVIGIALFLPDSEAAESAVEYISAKGPTLEFLEEYTAAADEIITLTLQDEKAEVNPGEPNES